MRVPARVFADEEILAAIREDRSLEQLQNVATLPGIVGAALAMPDVHQGYGFPVGGVAATAPPEGVVSPGGVGYDINCGVRLLALPLSEAELGERRTELVHQISRGVPAGAGRRGSIRLDERGTRARLGRGGAGAGRAARDRRRRRIWSTPSRGPPAGRRPGDGFRAGEGARLGPAGHDGLRQPLRRGAGGRRGSSTRRRPRRSGWRRARSRC